MERSRIPGRGVANEVGVSERVPDGCRCSTSGVRFHSVDGLLRVCAVLRRRFPVGANPTRQTLRPEATGAVVEVTKWLKPSGMGTILPRISTGPWVSYASHAWGMTSRGRRREVLSESRMRNLQVRFDERGVETELRRGYSGRRKGRQQTTQTYCHRATSRLYRTATVADQTARVQTRRSLTGQARPWSIALHCGHRSVLVGHERSMKIRFRCRR